MTPAYVVIGLILLAWGIARREALDVDGVNDGAFSAKKVEAALEALELEMEIRADKERREPDGVHGCAEVE